MEALFLVLVFLFVFFLVYFTPTIFAYMRGHNNQLAIFAANLFFGWSLIGWVITFIWALTSNTKQKEAL